MLRLFVIDQEYLLDCFFFASELFVLVRLAKIFERSSLQYFVAEAGQFCWLFLR